MMVDNAMFMIVINFLNSRTVELVYSLAGASEYTGVARFY